MFASDNYVIRDLEILSGIKAHTLRIWEKRYGLLNPERTETNIRRYSADQLKDLLNISLLLRKGYKISAIAGTSPSGRAKILMTEHCSNPENDFEVLMLQCMVSLDEIGFNRVFLSVLHGGFEQAMSNYIFPFLKKLGIWWQTGTICTAQEHFFSNLVRQKLVTAIGNLGLTGSDQQQKVLLLLPEYEQHELMLLYYNYLFRARGYYTVYLGQGIPITGLGEVMRGYKPDMIVTGTTMPDHDEIFSAFVNYLHEILPEVPIYAGGCSAVKTIFSITELNRLLSIYDPA